MRFAGMIVLAASVLASAQGSSFDAKAETSKLIAIENAWNQAQIHRDGDALNQLVADTFVHTDTDGSVMNKSKFIADIKDPSAQTTMVANDDVNVYFYPGVAVVIGAYHAKCTNRRGVFDHYGRITDTWIFSSGQWVCVASHTNLMKKPAR